MYILVLFVFLNTHTVEPITFSLYDANTQYSMLDYCKNASKVEMKKYSDIITKRKFENYIIIPKCMKTDKFLIHYNDESSRPL